MKRSIAMFVVLIKSYLSTGFLQIPEHPRLICAVNQLLIPVACHNHAGDEVLFIDALHYRYSIQSGEY